MNELKPIEPIDQLFAHMSNETLASPGLSCLHRKLIQACEQLKQPMRVAIVGLIKSGKSTTMNAMLGEVVVPIGTIETTFNVNWLCYSEQKALQVTYKDQRPAESRPFRELDALTRRAQENYETLLTIKYIKVFYPNTMLQTLQLVDTPGLGSIHEVDSQNARDFILKHGNELTETTQAEVAQADAALYLFSQSISASARDTLQEFQGPLMGSATPINSIGVLTMVDRYWPSENSPFDAANRVIKSLQSRHPQIQRLLYAIIPISGLLALGAQTLTQHDYEQLVELSAVPESVLKRRLRDAQRFTTESFVDVPLSPAQREALYKGLGQYGIWRACQHIRAGHNSGALREHLLQESGLPALCELVLSHFGNRAFLIKLDTILRGIAATAFQIRASVTGRDLDILKSVTNKCEVLAMQQAGIGELRVLRDYYDGKLSFTDSEVKQLLQVTGEYGTAYWQRLGIEEESRTTLERLDYALSVAQEALRHWRQRGDRAADRETRAATQMLARSYERIIYHLREAGRHLELA